MSEEEGPGWVIPIRGPLFAEPFDLDEIADALGPRWHRFPAMNWWHVFASPENWEDSALQLPRLYAAWAAAKRDTYLIDRLFHWLVDIATEYPDDESLGMATLLVRAVGRIPLNPDPRDAGYQAPRTIAEINAPRPKRKPITKALRFSVLQRDGFSCRYCGMRPPDAILQCDHIKPVSAGGKTTIDNLITACTHCNIGKGALYDARVALLNRVKWTTERKR